VVSLNVEAITEGVNKKAHRSGRQEQEPVFQKEQPAKRSEREKGRNPRKVGNLLASSLQKKKEEREGKNTG